jgi:hypothetical protein
MSSKVGKFLKKAKKTVTKTTKDAAKTVESTATDVAQGAEDLANDAAKSTEKAANDASKAVVGISKDALDATEKGLNAALQESEKLLNDAQEAVLKAATLDTVKKYGKEIKALTKVVKSITDNPKLKKSVESIVDKATSGKLDSEVTSALNDIFTTPEIKVQLQDIAPTTWPTITLGINGNGGYVAGVEASGGLGVRIPGSKMARSAVLWMRVVRSGPSAGRFQ